MGAQLGNNQAIDWSNPHDPKTKAALIDLLHVLTEVSLIEAETHAILTMLYITEKRDDLQRSEELTAYADQEIKKFWELLRPDVSEAIKHKDKDALSASLNIVTVKIDDLQRKNQELSDVVNQHQHEIAGVTAAWKARQLEYRAEVASKLEGKMTDIHGNVITSDKVKEILKQSAPVDIDKRFAQKDFHAKIEGIIDSLDNKEERTVFNQIAAADDVFSEMKAAAIGGMENGEPPTGGQFLKEVMKMKAINAFKRSSSNKSEDAADMQVVYHTHKKKMTCEKKIEENNSKIVVLKGAETSLEKSLNQMNIPEPPPPPPVMRR